MRKGKTCYHGDGYRPIIIHTKYHEVKFMTTLTPDTGLKIGYCMVGNFCQMGQNLGVAEIFMVSESGTRGLASSTACKCVHGKS